MDIIHLLNDINRKCERVAYKRTFEILDFGHRPADFGHFMMACTRIKEDALILDPNQPPITNAQLLEKVKHEMAISYVLSDYQTQDNSNFNNGVHEFTQAQVSLRTNGNYKDPPCTDFSDFTHLH